MRTRLLFKEDPPPRGALCRQGVGHFRPRVGNSPGLVRDGMSCPKDTARFPQEFVTWGSLGGAPEKFEMFVEMKATPNCQEAKKPINQVQRSPNDKRYGWMRGGAWTADDDLWHKAPMTTGRRQVHKTPPRVGKSEPGGDFHPRFSAQTVPPAIEPPSSFWVGAENPKGDLIFLWVSFLYF